VERRERWERFWARRDPVPATPINEFREAFFERVRIATEQFGEPGRPGWRTDRGEVFIVLGRPDMVYEEDGRVGDPMSMRRIIVWIYERGPTGRLELVFEDRSGFGRYELTPRVRERLPLGGQPVTGAVGRGLGPGRRHGGAVARRAGPSEASRPGQRRNAM